MSEVPVQVIVAAFQQENGAENALKDLKEAKKEHVIAIENAAVIRRDEKGKLHVKEMRDMGGGKGAAIGGVVGAVVGLLAGPVVLAAGAGALVGGLAAKLRDSGFPNERLKQFGDALTPGTSALVAVIDHTWVREVQERLAQFGADVMTESIKADIAGQLESGQEVAYTALSTDGGTISGRISSAEEQAAFPEGPPTMPLEQPGAFGQEQQPTQF
jgi:uncharacterized membrane protein